MWVRSLNKGFIEEIIVGVPMVFMTVMTIWALILNIKNWIDSIYAGTRTIADPVGILSSALVLLALSIIYISAKENVKLRTG
jgi:carbon starvation protein CstA